MTIIFEPSGHLDVSTDPKDLPQQGEGSNLMSGDMQRCKNLRLDRKGMAQERYGSSKINGSSAVDTSVYHIEEQAGTRYTFAGAKIYEDEAAIETGLTEAQWTACKYNAYNTTTQAVFALNGTDRKRIEGSSVLEWGTAAPSAAPTTGVGSGSGLTGEYSAKITYLRKEASVVVYESNPSPAGTTRTLDDESLQVTWTAPTDSQITHVRVYRTAADGSTYYQDEDIAIGTTTLDSDTADGDLGTATPPDNHDRPPLGTFVFGPTNDGHLFILRYNRIYYCLSKQPEYWPATYYVESGPRQFPLKAGCIFNGQNYVLSQTEVYLVQGTGANTFFPVGMSALCGTRGPKAIAAAVGYGIFHLGSDGIYLFNGASDRNMTNARFRTIFLGIETNGIPGVNLDYLDQCWMVFFKNRLWFGYPGGSNTTPSAVLVTDLKNEQSTYYEYPANFTAATVDEQNDRLLAADTDGYIWILDHQTQTTDGGTAISWEVESKDFTLPTRAHFPRWVKYDVDASRATTATGKVMLDGALHQKHTLNENRNVRRRLVNTGNGNRMSLRLEGTGPIAIHMLEAE